MIYKNLGSARIFVPGKLFKSSPTNTLAQLKICKLREKSLITLRPGVPFTKIRMIILRLLFGQGSFTYKKNTFKSSEDKFFSHVRSFYEQAVIKHRSLWVQVAHSSFIEGSHTTKNTASENVSLQGSPFQIEITRILLLEAIL